MIQTIPTTYNGIKYRSRLEARWAVFFDEIGVKYYYEHEDFLFKSGKRYLPDFYLPEIDAFCEVKHEFQEDSIYKCKLLCEQTKN